MSNKKAGGKTLLWSIIMSSPGPLVVGISLLRGKSTTQIADFIRRSSEFLAIVVSFVIFMIIARDDGNAEKKARLEERSQAFVGAMMCVAGLVMAILTVTVSHEDKGNVVPGLVIAIISILGNMFFWYKYTSLNKSGENAILKVQSRLYRAKVLVDAGVIAALTAVIISPDSIVTICLDILGSVVIAFYLILSGLKTIRQRKQQKKDVLTGEQEIL